MDVSLTPELERYVHDKVRDGAHPSADEVVAEGLRLLQRRDERRRRKLEELRQMIQVGIDQADRGELEPFTEDTLAEIRAAALRRSDAKRGAETS